MLLMMMSVMRSCHTTTSSQQCCSQYQQQLLHILLGICVYSLDARCWLLHHYTNSVDTGMMPFQTMTLSYVHIICSDITCGVSPFWSSFPSWQFSWISFSQAPNFSQIHQRDPTLWIHSAFFQPHLVYFVERGALHNYSE